MSRAICNICGKIVYWRAQRGSRLKDYLHCNLIKTDCRGTLRAYRSGMYSGRPRDFPIEINFKDTVKPIEKLDLAEELRIHYGGKRAEQVIAKAEGKM